MPQDRNDLNGLRVQLPGQAAIYLMDKGKKRHIPNPQVYNELFKSWDGVVQDINVNDIPTGEQIPETGLLFRNSGSPKVYLLDGVSPNQVRRHIAAPNVMDRYHFNWGRIHVLPDAITFPDGDQIRNP